MKTLIKFFYLSIFVFFAITSKPLRLICVYQQERFLQVAKEIGTKLSSERAHWLTAKINCKVNELKDFLSSQKIVDPSHEKAVYITEEVNELVKALVTENTSSLMYRCFVWFT